VPANNSIISIPDYTERHWADS